MTAPSRSRTSAPGDDAWRTVIVHSDRWAGMSRRLPRSLVVQGVPPASIVARVREVRVPLGRGDPLRLEQRERELLCTYVDRLNRTVFYTPASGQHADDERWPDAARTILSIWLDPSASA